MANTLPKWTGISSDLNFDACDIGRVGADGKPRRKWHGAVFAWLDKYIPEMRAFKEQGLSYREIADKFNVGHMVIYRRINNGVYRSSRDHRNCGIRGLHIPKREAKPNSCELCGNPLTVRRPLWHHWDHNYWHVGLWLCSRCHRFAEFVDWEGSPKYLELREKYLELKRKHYG